MEEYIQTLTDEFEKNSNADNAKWQKAYLKDKFEFYGLKSPQRRDIQKPFLVKAYLPEKEVAHEIVSILWQKPQREFHYFAQELAQKYTKQMDKKDMALFEYMVETNSWWDTVDFIAINLMGEFFMNYPELRYDYVQKWLRSNNMWLQRSAVIFQLKYKKEVDTELLRLAINELLGSKEFFINKAIGWMLRQYSRTNPKWVVEFTEKTKLAPLSKREALRLLELK